MMAWMDHFNQENSSFPKYPTQVHDELKELIISTNTAIPEFESKTSHTLGGNKGKLMDISIKSNGEAKNHTSVDHVQGDNNDFILEINSLEHSINAPPPPSNVRKPCIYRVPSNLYRLNKKQYTPQTVSIGPFHHGKKELSAIEDLKPSSLQSFLEITELSLEDIEKAIAEWEDEARGCYSETINLTGEEFKRMLLLDSCFLMETILRGNSNPNIMRDLILLENQLPFFILDGLYKLVLTRNTRKETFLELCIVYFTKIMLLEKTRNIVKSISGQEVKHFVDLLRLCHLPSAPRLLPESQVPRSRIRCAGYLQEAGMKFWRGSRDHLLDIKYTSSGVLEIPQVILEQTSEILLRNLLALERLHYTYETYITDYICFMDKLISSSKDVDILVQNNIIQNWIGDKNNSDVAALFHGLGSEVSTWWPAYYYAKVSEDLNSYGRVGRSRWNVGIIHDFCSSRRMMAVTIMATTLLVYTYEQTLFSILYYGI